MTMHQISFRLAITASALLLAGCATVNIDQTLQETNRAFPGFTGGRLELSRTEAKRHEREQLTADLLDKPLSMDDAVRVALANSPALQGDLALQWADLEAAAQAGRLPNPLFTFEHQRIGDELEIGRLLSAGLLDLIMYPQRQAVARTRIDEGKLRLGAAVVEQVNQVRRLWVRAVAAGQLLAYARQVDRSAKASAELARRMQQVGNFSKLQRARQQAFYADAAAQLAIADQAVTTTREELVRQLGLTSAQAARLRLPERLPDLPKEPRPAAAVAAEGLRQRLDVRIARLQLEAAARAQRLDVPTSVLDIEAAPRRDTTFNNSTGARTGHGGYQFDVRVPLFDWGGARRAAMTARTLAAANYYEAVVRSAASQLREGYAAYRSTLDLARHYRDEIVPLRQTISEENQMRYNGMLIGVFELLADSRDQIGAVMAAIDAQQQFWLADAALSSTMVGQPVAVSLAAPLKPALGTADGH